MRRLPDAASDWTIDQSVAQEIFDLADEMLTSATGRQRDQCQYFRDRAQEALGRGTPDFRQGLPVSTADHIPGFIVTDYIGEVVGVVVRSRGAGPQIGAQLKAIGGGELHAMTNLMRDARREAVERMVSEAEAREADAVIGVRFDVETIFTSWAGVCAYGTAVKAHRAAVPPQT